MPIDHRVRLQLSFDVNLNVSQICFTIVVPLYMAPAMKWVPGGRILMYPSSTSTWDVFAFRFKA